MIMNKIPFYLGLFFLLLACNKGSNHHNDSLELVFSDNIYQLTGVAKEPGGRLMVNYPRWSDIYRYSLVEVTGQTSVKPYPNKELNDWNPKEPGEDKWVCVQSVYFDDNGDLWIVDPAAPELKRYKAMEPN